MNNLDSIIENLSDTIVKNGLAIPMTYSIDKINIYIFFTEVHAGKAVSVKRAYQTTESGGLEKEDLADYVIEVHSMYSLSLMPQAVSKEEAVLIAIEILAQITQLESLDSNLEFINDAITYRMLIGCNACRYIISTSISKYRKMLLSTIAEKIELAKYFYRVARKNVPSDANQRLLNNMADGVEKEIVQLLIMFDEGI